MFKNGDCTSFQKEFVHPTHCCISALEYAASKGLPTCPFQKAPFKKRSLSQKILLTQLFKN